MKRLWLGFSGLLCGLALGAAALAQNEAPAARSAAQRTHAAATVTTLKVSSGTLGQPITFDVTVRALATAGSPTGTVSIVDHTGATLQTLTLAPTNSTNRKFAYSAASYTLTQSAGYSMYYFGGYFVGAEFIPGSSNFLTSRVVKTMTVRQPKYETVTNGVKIATIAEGSGAAIESGQTASVLYTGFLELTGSIFDDSEEDDQEFTFTVGDNEDAIPGFSAGTIGMKVGETRIIQIRPAQGYGDQPVEEDGEILVPANSTLIFVVTLESIS
jgi:hypothetical protein